MHCSAAAVVVVSLVLLPVRALADAGGVSDAWIMTTVRKHCAMCHSENPSHTMLLGQPPPKGVVLESIDDVRRFAPRVAEMVVRKRLMPFGNETAMTEADRIRFGQWLAAQ
jgi:uncharacterized membrane protein